MSSEPKWKRKAGIVCTKGLVQGEWLVAVKKIRQSAGESQCPLFSAAGGGKSDGAAEAPGESLTGACGR